MRFQFRIQNYEFRVRMRQGQMRSGKGKNVARYH